MKKKVELLAPAGNYEGFIGAVNAGADAIYLGGEKFSARAYAENFTNDEIIKAIDYAHLFGRKVYLTLNTLIKEREFNQVHEYIRPFYLAGLDGIIIQDLGVFKYVKEHFPMIELHISTQMTITGVKGARFMKENGASRIVPARELSLTEIKKIKDEVDVEIEAFVHGAMCYCYSGLCLFSSLLGGRSGNRGRCAQPCRLPYDVKRQLLAGNKSTLNYKSIFENDETYMLSLKDMYTLPMIPELIEAGIDSFKIEGRMKKPEYAAGVTALYRKYIDLYYKNTGINPDFYKGKEIPVSREDQLRMKSLYIRSDLQNGYYHKLNGKEMVTLSKPSYLGSDDTILTQVRTDYIEKPLQLPLECKVVLKTGKPATLTIIGKKWDGQSMAVTIEGEIVSEAKNRPLSREDVNKQIIKTGGSNFVFQKIEIDMDNNIFIANSVLNQLRRDGLYDFEELLLSKSRRFEVNINSDLPEKYKKLQEKIIPEIEEKISQSSKPQNSKPQGKLSALISNKEQMDSLKNMDLSYIAMELDCLLDEIIPFTQDETIIAYLKEFKSDKYLALPYIIRNKDYTLLQGIVPYLSTDNFKGIIIRNIEEIQWLHEINYQGDIIADANMYTWNSEAKEYFEENNLITTVPVELNIHEIIDLSAENMEMMIYGYIPMMITANCIKKTSVGCDHKEEIMILNDRYNASFQVKNCCRYCYNIIYNSVPLSLHGNIKELSALNLKNFRLVFTRESGNEAFAITNYFKELMEMKQGKAIADPVYKEFTKGHLKRGVE